MMVLPPVAAAQAGRASGGGFLDSIRAAASGGTGAPAPAPAASGDGSVGLFDGVWKKAALGGAAGAVVGFIPFLPGGPILGGIMGALGGAALGVFSNWRTMKAIKAENEATLAAMGVQVDDPQVKQILQSGNVSQLIPLMQQGAVGQAGVAQAGVGQAGVGQAGALPATASPPPTQQGPRIKQVTDPATGVTQTINVDTGTVVEPGAAPAQAAPAQTAGIPTTALPPAVDRGSTPGQSPLPTQGSITVGSRAAATAPGMAVDPGVAPSRAAGGGAAGDVGRPPAPVGVHSGDTRAIAPAQAGVGAPVAGGLDGAAALEAPISSATARELARLVRRLEQQIEELRAHLAQRDELSQPAAG